MKTIATCLLAMLLGASVSHAAMLTDNFTASHDYSGGSVAGTIWSGVMNTNGLGTGGVFDANISNPGRLTIKVVNTNTGYDGSHSNGPFLYIATTGDFNAIVHYTGGSTNPYSSPALLAFANSTNFLSTTFLASTPMTGFRTVIGGTQTDNNGAAGSYYEIIRAGNVYTSEVSSDGVNYAVLGSYTATTGPLSASTINVGITFGNYGGSGTSDGEFNNFTLTTAGVPEPSTWALCGLGGLVLILKVRRTRSAA